MTSEGLSSTKDLTEGQKISEILSRINEIESNGPPPTGYMIYLAVILSWALYFTPYKSGFLQPHKL